MFVVIISYTAELDQIDDAMDDHRGWLSGQYADGVFVASGPQDPRAGGIILCTATDRGDLEERLALDPFALRGLAEHEVIEFHANRVADGYEDLRDE